ncbi:hypothetical protein [Sphingobacterium hungaricum]
MKYIVAFILTLLILTTLTYFVLLTWDINLFHAEYLGKAYATFGLLVAGSLLLTLVIALFFGGRRNKYDKSATGVAQRKL